MPPKKAAEKRDVSVTIRLVPYYAIEFDGPRLGGATAVGKSPKDVMANCRSHLRRLFPFGEYDLTVIEHNPDAFAKAGVHFEED